MIAPIRHVDIEENETRRRFRSVRRLVAAMMLDKGRSEAPQARPIAAWRAWLFAAWAFLAVAAYVAYMLEWAH